MSEEKNYTVHVKDGISVVVKATSADEAVTIFFDWDLTPPGKILIVYNENGKQVASYCVGLSKNGPELMDIVTDSK